MPPTDADLLRLFTTAAADLLYPSESDAPFTPISFPASAIPPLLTLANGRPLQSLSLPAFFAELESPSNPDAPRRATLRQLLESHLTNPQAHRIGSRQLDLYLLGQSPAGSWLGLHTTSIET